jgi:hypothetical protein
MVVVATGLLKLTDALAKIDRARELGMNTLLGMPFRDPQCAERTSVFGYPSVPLTTEMNIAVQSGEVVNPSAKAAVTGQPKIFLFSAIARPGNSGGPIVAQDGRVIGLLVEDSAETNSSGDAPEDKGFDRGIPSSEVIRAVTDLGFGDLAKIEDWA